MPTPADIAAQHDAGLALLFERGLELALQVQADAMVAETAEARAKLAQAFHRITRGVRQTAALRAKLANDSRRAEREVTAEVIRLDERRLTKRRAQVRATVERLVWTEAEGERAEQLIDDLDTFLDEDALYGRLADGDVETHIARLCEELGLKPPPQGEGDREAVAGASSTEPPWQSSA